MKLPLTKLPLTKLPLTKLPWTKAAAAPEEPAVVRRPSPVRRPSAAVSAPVVERTRGRGKAVEAPPMTRSQASLSGPEGDGKDHDLQYWLDSGFLTLPKDPGRTGM